MRPSPLTVTSAAATPAVMTRAVVAKITAFEFPIEIIAESNYRFISKSKAPGAKISGAFEPSTHLESDASDNSVSDSLFFCLFAVRAEHSDRHQIRFGWHGIAVLFPSWIESHG
jgi:hypothetical protein